MAILSGQPSHYEGHDVCVFIAFYYKLLNSRDEHVIKCETHRGG